MGSLEATGTAVAAHGVELALILAGSVVAYTTTCYYVPTTARKLFSRNIYGIDINKTTPAQRQEFAAKRRAGKVEEKEFMKLAVPESLGILAGTTYLSVVVVLSVVIPFFSSSPSSMTAPQLFGPLMTITVMLLLGFVDDVLDTMWRHKIILSAIGSLPLIMTYDGSLSVLFPNLTTLLGCHAASVEEWVIGLNATTTAMNASGAPTGFPSQLHPSDGLGWSTLFPQHWIGTTIKDMLTIKDGSSRTVLLYLGPAYLLYLSLLCIFCTNSINILAGVNGVEVGQSIVIAVASVVYNLLQLRLEQLTSITERVQAPEISSDHQIRSLLLLGPFIGVSLALWHFNKYPASIFIGDSYTYFAGTVLAVSGITGVYSKTLLLFFSPQIFNFIISIPQLFHIVPCPRHRVPKWNPKTNCLSNSHNYTLLNVILWLFGDMHEAKLTMAVIRCQIITCTLGFLVRYWIASYLYDSVR